MAQVDLQSDDRQYDPLIQLPVTDTAVRVNEPFDLRTEYRNILGRDPDAGELATEPGNVEKYGLSQLRSNLTDRAKNRTPGGGGVQGYGPLFDDDSTNQLEGIARAQMGELRSNPDLNNLLGFMRQQFTQLSQNPGYTNEDLALLNTQAFEPIEQRRNADQRRVLERTAARGMLPSSGLTEEMAQSVDTEANRQRTVAGRELGISAINQRRADLNQALQMGSMLGLDIPRSQRAEELDLSKLLYQLPRNALNDLMMVLGGSSSPNDLFSQTLNASNQSNLLRQQDDERNAALMSQIGSILGSLFR